MQRTVNTYPKHGMHVHMRLKRLVGLTNVKAPEDEQCKA